MALRVGCVGAGGARRLRRLHRERGVWDKDVCCFPEEVAGEPRGGEACTCVHLSTAARAYVACMCCERLHRMLVGLHARR